MKVRFIHVTHGRGHILFALNIKVLRYTNTATPETKQTNVQKNKELYGIMIEIRLRIAMVVFNHAIFGPSNFRQQSL